MTSNVSAHLGEQGDTFATRYQNQVNINRQHGLSFYSMDWGPHDKSKVTFEHGKHTLTVDNVMGVSSVQDVDYPKEGISELDITESITPPDGISHDEARQKMFDILQGILRAGWAMFIDRGDPRLRGKDAFNFVLGSSPYSSLDAAYSPSLNEWMQIQSLTPWKFYADHIYLEVTFMREHTLTDPTKPGAYIITFNFKNEPENYRGYVDPHDRKKWKELLPAELAKLPPMRAEAEAKMRAKGLKIDETYQDPPVPDLTK